MKFYRISTLVFFGVLAVLLTALHSPGEMSVDSVMALYEAMKGHAEGWGPTFMAATLEWFGGGTLGSSLFVALMCILTYGCFTALLIDRNTPSVPRWQIASAFVLSLNPLFMFYIGIIWKDVMLATIAVLAATLLLLAVGRTGRNKYILIGIAAIVTGAMVPIRQQGILLAAPFAIIEGLLVAKELRAATFTRAIVFLGCIAFVISCNIVFYELSAATVKPQLHGPVSVGIYTIQAYEIAGMIANAKPDDPAIWSGASQQVQREIKTNYSSERIDTIWHLEPVRDYFNALTGEQYMTIWLRGIKHDPKAFLQSRFGAFASLLGLRSIAGCVPAFWGIGALPALPEQVKQLGLHDGMDARAKLIGRAAVRLYNTPVFRNWFYALLLLIVSFVALIKTTGVVRLTLLSIIVANWLYWLSFLPTTIACDFRYLYPVAALTTILWVYMLVNIPIGLWPHKLWGTRGISSAANETTRLR